MTTSFGMCSRLLLASAALLLATAASADTRPYTSVWDSVAFPGTFDANADGSAADHGIVHGRSNLGPLTSDVWSELLPWGGASFCGPTHLLLRFRFVDIKTRTSDGSRFFSSLDSGSACFDFTTGNFTFEIHMNIVGGVGRFAGATGQYTVLGGREAPFTNGMNANAGTIEGTITTP
jgi:hypothetical protein